ncbi:histidine phosphatase family protein [Candidatus Gracilibacteria bacterium]|nr:histidine phosphatase family protein [Candidatus Gracilibacteria bacterium]
MATLQGWNNTYGLNKTGEQQVEVLATKLQEQITVLMKQQGYKTLHILPLTSDLIRATETNNKVRLRLKNTIVGTVWHPTITTKQLRERDFGIFEGQPSSALASDPRSLAYRALTEINEKLTYIVDPTVETDGQIITRCTALIDPLLDQCENQTEPYLLLLSTHGGTLNALVRSINHTTQSSPIENCGSFTFTVAQWRNMARKLQQKAASE